MTQIIKLPVYANGAAVFDADNNPVAMADIRGGSYADILERADFIVRAVNNHDALVAALAELIAARESPEYDLSRMGAAWDNARAVLAKAKEIAR